MSRPENGVRSVRSFLVEGAVIVGSILLAFAIDASWDSIGERRLERELLAGLRTDFERNQVLLGQTRTQHESYRDAALRFLELASPGASPTGAEVDDDTIIRLVSWSTYNPALGSLHAATGSGRLSLISNGALRAELAMWTGLVEDFNEQAFADKGHAERFAALAFTYVPFRSAVARLGHPSIVRESTAEPDYQGLLDDLVAENIATNRVAEIGFMLSDLAVVEQSLEAILGFLEEELR